MALSISLGGKVVEGKREHEKTLQDIEEKNLELRKQQRREEAREGLMIDPDKKSAGLKTDVKSNVAAFEQIDEAGLKTSKDYAAAGTGTGTGKGTGKEGTEGKGVGRVPIPDKLKFWEEKGYPQDPTDPKQREGEGGIAFLARKTGSDIMDAVRATGDFLGITAYAFARDQAKQNISQWREAMIDPEGGEPQIVYSEFGDTRSNLPTFNTEEGRKAAGFKSDEEVRAFYDQMEENEGAINKWFGERAGTAKIFMDDMSNAEQVQTIKHIISKAGKVDPDSGLTAEEKKEAKEVAGQMNQVRKKAGLEGPSVVEKFPPSAKWTENLIEGDPEKPTGEWADAVEAHNDAVYKYNLNVWIGDDEGMKDARLALAEVKGLKAQVQRAKGVQAVVDFNTGDTRLMDAMMSEKFREPTMTHHVGGGRFTVYHLDDNGQPIPRPGYENVTQQELRHGFKLMVDKVYKEEYDATVSSIAAEERKFAQSVKLKEVEFQNQLLIEIVKGRNDIATEKIKQAGGGGKISKGVGRDGRETTFLQLDTGEVLEFSPASKDDRKKGVPGSFESVFDPFNPSEGYLPPHLQE